MVVEKYAPILLNLVPKCINCGRTGLNVQQDIYVMPTEKETPKGVAIDRTKGCPTVALICPNCSYIHLLSQVYLDKKLEAK